MNHANLYILRQKLKDGISVVDRLLSEEQIRLERIKKSKGDVVEYVLSEIASYTLIKKEDLIVDPSEGNRQTKQKIVRYIACYILSDYYGISNKALAQRFNYATPVGIIAARNKVRGWMANKEKAPREAYFMVVNILSKLNYEKE